MRPAALSLGRALDMPGGSFVRSLIRGARPGGGIVPLDRQEPATHRVALWHRRRPGGGLLLSLAQPIAAHRAGRMRNPRGFRALGIGRLDPAPYARALSPAPIESLAYEFPLFHSSIVVALVALVLRVDLSVGHQIAWTGHGWFPLSLAAVGLVMLRAYPHRACVHTSLAFLTWSVVAAIVPSLTSVCYVGLAGLSLALGLLLIERFVRPHEPALCARLGVIDAGYAPVVRGWALAVFGLSASLAIVVVVGEMSSTILGHGPIAAGSKRHRLVGHVGDIGVDRCLSDDVGERP